MTISNASYSRPVVLDASHCKFEECKFQNATANDSFVQANDADLYCSFVSCLFYQIKVSSSHYVLYINNAVEEIQDRCCYSEETSWHIYTSEINLKSESVNSTICTNSNSYAPYCCCSTEFTSFFNNHSFLYRTGDYVSCYRISTTPIKENNNCYFSGSSCSGVFPATLHSNNPNCVLTKFNFVNNTDSSGYFYLAFNNHKRVKESVIVFKSTDKLRWMWSATSGATLSIEESFVIASGAIDGGGRVTLKMGTTVTKTAQTHTPFRSHPKNAKCINYFRLNSDHFSHSIDSFPKSMVPLLIFVPILVK